MKEKKGDIFIYSRIRSNTFAREGVIVEFRSSWTQESTQQVNEYHVSLNGDNFVNNYQTASRTASVQSQEVERISLTANNFTNRIVDLTKTGRKFIYENRDIIETAILVVDVIRTIHN